LGPKSTKSSAGDRAKGTASSGTGAVRIYKVRGEASGQTPPKLIPRRNASASAVAAHQRGRLHAAMIEACADRGYSATTTRELVALAGVSKKALYQRFESKQDCFLATYDLVVREAVERISDAYRGDPDGEREADWTNGLCRAFNAFAAELVERPGPSHLALVEVLSAGPAAVERIESAESVFVAMIRRTFDQAPDSLDVAPGLIRPLIGGIWSVAQNRLLEGRAEEFATCGTELGDWLLRYRCADDIPLLGIPAYQPGSRADHAWGDAADERSRLLQAAASVIARGGHGELAEAGIAELASVTPDRFAANFKDAEQCFLATLEFLSARAFARAIRESNTASSWAAGVCLAIRSLSLQVATDRALAHAAFVDRPAASPASRDRRAELMRAFADVLFRRAPSDCKLTMLAAEAIVGAVWSLLQRQVNKGRPDRLPALSGRAAFLVLAPIIGADAALDTINSELRSPAGDAPH